MHIEERRTIERRAKTKTKQNKQTSHQRKTTRHPPEGKKFTPLVANQLHGERTRTSPHALSYLPLDLSGHVRAYYCMPLSSPGFLCSDQLCHETFRPLFRRPAQFPLVLSCSRPLVGVDAKSSEVVQETPPPHPFFFLTPHAARAPHQFSEHHTLR